MSAKTAPHCPHQLDTSDAVEELENPGSEAEKEDNANTANPQPAMALKNTKARLTSLVKMGAFEDAARFFDFRGALAFLLAVVVATIAPNSLVYRSITVPRSS
jgi:hypothetical protein